MTEDKSSTYWLAGFEGNAIGGYWVRNSLKEFFESLEAKGIKPVGIRYNATFNLEIIVDAQTVPMSHEEENRLKEKFKAMEQQLRDANPRFDLEVEYGRLLMKPLHLFTDAEKKRHDELARLLSQ